MTGALMQLVAYGAQDVYLSGNPQMTFFKTVYRRHTNFSMECIKQDLKGTVGANSRVVATLARRGDLVHDCFIKVPEHTSGSNFNEGHNIFDYIELEIGGQCIDKHYGHWMEVYSELTEDQAHFLDKDHGGIEIGKVGGGPSDTYATPTKFQVTAMAGGVETEGRELCDSYVPLRFWFCRHIGLSLPLIALQYHGVNINVKFSSAATGFNTDPSLWCNYIYLDTDERRRFAQVSHEYLIEQVQMQSFTAVPGGDTLKLNFNHPVKELIWAGTDTNLWGSSTGGKFHTMGDGAATFQGTWQLKLNGHDRFEKQSLTYFTRYQPYKYHNSMSVIGRPQPGDESLDSIAVYSFALKPEEIQPSGTCNFSRIDNARLIYSSIVGDVVPLYVYAVNYNVLRIMSGMGGLAYSN